MILKNKIEEITLDKKGIILSYKEREQKILFSEVDQIYITVKKTNPFYEFMVILISICIAIFSFLFLQTNIILLLCTIIIIAIVAKINTFQKYGLKICLKNGDFLKKNIPLKLKNEAIYLVNDIKKGIYDYNVEKN